MPYRMIQTTQANGRGRERVQGKPTGSFPEPPAGFAVEKTTFGLQCNPWGKKHDSMGWSRCLVLSAKRPIGYSRVASISLGRLGKTARRADG